MPKTSLAIVTIVAAVLTAAAILWLDAPTADASYGVRESWLHGLARRLGKAGEIHWYLVPALALALVWHKAHPPRARKALFVATAVGAAGLVSLALKAVIGRTRPLLWMEDGVHHIHFFQFEYNHMAFPSGHATTAFATMTALAILFPRAAVPLLGVATLLAAARVVGLSHYLSDVTAGAWLGAVTAIALAPRMLPVAAKETPPE